MSDPGAKFDTGKRRYGLLPVQALGAVVDVLTYGAAKYTPNGWTRVPNAHERYTDALMRHLEAWRAGEVTDPESGLHHMAHVACNALFLLGLVLDASERS